MKNYQCLILLVPDIEESKIDNIFDIVHKHAVVKDKERWGVKKMAYPVKQAISRVNYVTAYYIVANIKAEDTKKLEKDLLKNTDVIKVICVRTEGKDD